MITSEALNEFIQDFNSNVAAEAHAAESLKEHIFVETMGELLADYGEVEDCICCHYKTRGIKVDGYHFDDEFNSLTLIVSLWIDSDGVDGARISDTDVNSAFNRGTNFLTKSLKGLHDKIELSNEAHDLSRLIYEARNDITSIKIILITDGITKKRAAEIEEFEGKSITQVIWDIERTCEFYKTGKRDSISINFAEDFGGPLPCVSHKDELGKYETYLAFIPGNLLADIYSHWGTKLLDMNVRVFLSARGNVNKGIRNTIINNPELFCAFNNGITAFARNVEFISETDKGLSIASLDDFQIVNGGQTTASLYHTRKKNNADLTSTYVQMKLAVITDPDDVEVLVPRISEYSNTQNKIQLSDLLANEPPHPELHAISISTLAPDPTGGSKQTYWFYEKSRGSYEETRNLTALTTAQRRKYDELRPKRQRFDKNKFGKVWNTYLLKPNIVSLGAQKNFARFNSWLREQSNEEWGVFFKKTVALIILWNTAELIVRRMKFEGYHHSIVTYTLAWLFKLTDMKIDLDKIWVSQKVDDNVIEVIEGMSQIVNDHIRDTEKNVTEWCKKEDCWKMLLNKHFTLPENIKSALISDRPVKTYNPTITSEKEVIEFCESKGSTSWYELSKWLKERQFLTGKARSQCFNMGRALHNNREPSHVLSIACKKIWEEAVVRGWNS